MLGQLTYDDFKDLKGRPFDLQGPGGRVEVTLLDVRLSPYSPASRIGRHAFAILFVAPKDPPLGARVYNIVHPRLGLMEGVLINPVVPPAADLDRTREVRFYEVVFN